MASIEVTCPACGSGRVVQGPAYERSACVCWDCGHRFRAWGPLTEGSTYPAARSLASMCGPHKSGAR